MPCVMRGGVLLQYRRVAGGAWQGAGGAWQGAPCFLVPRHHPAGCMRQVHQEMVEAKDTPTSGTAISTRVKKLTFPPFIKDLFLGNFNKSVLSYAEVLNYERHARLEDKVADIRQFMEGKKEVLEMVDKTGRLPPELLHSFKQSGMFGLSLPEEVGGAELLATEVARILEELGRTDMSVSEVMNINEYLGGGHVIMRHGTEEQKSKYLPALTSGDWVGAYCVHEPMAGSDPESIRCLAVECEDDPAHYLLNGGKTWVAQAQTADLFTVWAKLSMRNYLGEPEDMVTSFLVERTAGGIEVSEPYPMTGMKGLEVCDVTFTNCKIPKSAVLGNAGEGKLVLQSILHRYKYMVGAGVVASLRTLLDETVHHTNDKKQYGLPLAEFSLIKHQLAQCAARIYCLESMIYMTAGLEDVSEEPDVEVESVIVKQYAAEAFDFVTKTCLSILGIDKVNQESSRYQKYLRDSQMLQSWQGTSNINKCFIGVSGIIHMTSQDNLGVEGLRQPNRHPIKYMKYMWNQRKHRDDTYPLELNLESCIHPRMRTSAGNLEWAVQKVPFIARELLMQQGANIQLEEKNLERLADMVMEVYAMTCALSRSSRSYCVGHAHAEHEIHLAISYTHEARLRVKARAWECINYRRDQANRDDFWESASDYMTRRGGYQAVHPLTKNSF